MGNLFSSVAPFQKKADPLMYEAKKGIGLDENTGKAKKQAQPVQRSAGTGLLSSSSVAQPSSGASKLGQ